MRHLQIEPPNALVRGNDHIGGVSTKRLKRDAQINEIWQVVQDEQLYIPIHHQVLNWGMKSNIDTIVAPDDTAKFKYFRIN